MKADILFFSVLFICGCVGITLLYYSYSSKIINSDINQDTLNINTSKVDNDVLLQFKNNDKVNVIISLVDKGSTEANLKQREEITSSLMKDEFELNHKSITDKWFSGYLTRKGLIKFSIDERVDKIHYNRPMGPIPVEESTPTQFTVKSLTYNTTGDKLVNFKAILFSKTGTPIDLTRSTISMKIHSDTIVYTFGGRGNCTDNLSLSNTFYVNYLNSSWVTNDVLGANNSVEVCWKTTNGVGNITVKIIPRVGSSTIMEMVLGSNGDIQ